MELGDWRLSESKLIEGRGLPCPSSLERYWRMSVSVDQLAVAGGTPVRDIKARPWPSWPIATEEDITAVADVLRSGKWNRWRSDRVVALEEALQEFTGAAHVVALASGTAGLEVALKAAGVRPRR